MELLHPAGSTPIVVKKDGRVPRLIVILQIVNFFLLILFYSSAYWRLEEIRSHRSRQEVELPRAKRDIVYENPDDLSQWTVVLGHDTIIPKSVFERSCSRVHTYCAEKGKKLRGHPGKQGAPGPVGPSGPTGSRGAQGRQGPMGLVGDVGDQGPKGRDGMCNCSLPDLYVQRIAIPGPPVIKIEEKLVPVPVVVVKEVEVTKLVPFEPTPPGFAPPRGWSVGMPADLRFTRPYPPKTPVSSQKPPFRWTRPARMQSTTEGPSPPPSGLPSNVSEPTAASNFTFEPPSTTLPPYIGPPTLGDNRRVGIPVLHAESQYGNVGSWYRDTLPMTDRNEQKRWVTDDFASPVLYEYENERALMDKKQNIKYYVDFLASGTGSMIYNGSYLYHRHSSNILVRYDLESAEQTQSDGLGLMANVDCPRRLDQTFQQCNESDRDTWLYNRQSNYVDFSMDENGLWVLYTRNNSPRLMVSKLETGDFHVVNTWELDVNGTDFADAFIMCGTVYGLESATERDTFISYGYDLYRNESFFVDIPWYNPYRGLTMLHYNPLDQRLYFFDSGKLLSVNVRTDEDEYGDEDGEVDDALDVGKNEYEDDSIKGGRG